MRCRFSLTQALIHLKPLDLKRNQWTAAGAGGGEQFSNPQTSESSKATNNSDTESRRIRSGSKAAIKQTHMAASTCRASGAPRSRNGFPAQRPEGQSCTLSQIKENRSYRSREEAGQLQSAGNKSFIQTWRHFIQRKHTRNLQEGRVLQQAFQISPTFSQK